MAIGRDWADFAGKLAGKWGVTARDVVEIALQELPADDDQLMDRVTHEWVIAQLERRRKQRMSNAQVSTP